MLSRLIIALAVLGIGLSATTWTQHTVNAQSHVETLVARQHVCCIPPAGDCYWDDTPPPCEAAGTQVDHTGACCPHLSNEDELTAIVIKKSREAHMTSKRAHANVGVVDAAIVKKDNDMGKDHFDYLLNKKAHSMARVVKENDAGMPMAKKGDSDIPVLDAKANIDSAQEKKSQLGDATAVRKGHLDEAMAVKKHHAGDAKMVRKADGAGQASGQVGDTLAKKDGGNPFEVEA